MTTSDTPNGDEPHLKRPVFFSYQSGRPHGGPQAFGDTHVVFGVHDAVTLSETSTAILERGIDCYEEPLHAGLDGVFCVFKENDSQ